MKEASKGKKIVGADKMQREENVRRKRKWGVLREKMGGRGQYR